MAVHAQQHPHRHQHHNHHHYQQHGQQQHPMLYQPPRPCKLQAVSPMTVLGLPTARVA
jgi:hypothetical protein